MVPKLCRFVEKPRVGLIPRIVFLPVSIREQVVSHAVFTARRVSAKHSRP
jgi:hypothetical protein